MRKVGKDNSVINLAMLDNMVSDALKLADV